MAVFRIEKTRDYTVMSNYHLRDRSLSLKAKGLLSLMLSLPEDWDHEGRRICKDGIDSISGGIRGWRRTAISSGRASATRTGSLAPSVPFGQPRTGTDAAPIREKPIRENQYRWKANVGCPIQENPAQLNTKEQNKKNYQLRKDQVYPIKSPTQRKKQDPDRTGCGSARATGRSFLENIDYDILTQDEKSWTRDRLDEAGGAHSGCKSAPTVR